MANTEVPLLYNEYRLRAIKKALEESGSSVEQVLKNKLDSVYRDIVSVEEQEQIEEMIHREESASQQNNRAYGIYHLHGYDGDMHIATLNYNSLLQFGRLFQGHLQYKAYSYSLDSIACLFGQHKELDPVLFQSFCDTFQSNDNVSLIADVDFERGYLSVLEKGSDEWRTYRLDDVSNAVTSAYETPELSEYERYGAFTDALKEKEICDAETSFMSEDSAPVQQIL
ncbi:MAG: hypothetical protein IJG87_03650 [Ruminococcus sp.]|nr:hypothetical protein [Ruminococcus sp.]